ncbi:MAG: T9SS type A sorting domain-containing protein [Ignavibacteriae bacterium]|nr:T9SS type A sorting domain-containing protein [Ignavibacteriota bacterium]
MRKILYILPLFVLAFTLTGNPPSGWYQQFMPDIGSRSIQDIFFLDSLTGWAVTNATNQNPDTTYVLKTTNSGDNWVIQYAKIQTGGGFPGYFGVFFLDENTGYTCGVKGVDKTTDGGASWTSLNAPLNSYLDMSVLNEDTIWTVSSNSLTGGVYRTTNGGMNWENQFSGGSSNPEKIYMYNGSIGFIARNPFPPVNDKFYKTTNGGVNWFNIDNDGFRHMQFIDSLTGWKATGLDDSSMKKTTDGGITWHKQQMPNGGIIQSNTLSKFSIINKDTVIGIGGYIHYPNNQERGIIFRTTNGGSNWHFQIPDTNLNIVSYNFINTSEGKFIWCYANYQPPTGIHSTTGEDTNWITSIKHLSNHLPDEFILYQNYPNPFNPITNLKFKVKSIDLVTLKVFDITGKEIATLVNEKLSPGEYEYQFDGSDLTSGVYFYQLRTKDFTSTKKMILVK